MLGATQSWSSPLVHSWIKYPGPRDDQVAVILLYSPGPVTTRRMTSTDMLIYTEHSTDRPLYWSTLSILSRHSLLLLWTSHIPHEISHFMMHAFLFWTLKHLINVNSLCDILLSNTLLESQRPECYFLVFKQHVKGVNAIQLTLDPAFVSTLFYISSSISNYLQVLLY